MYGTNNSSSYELTPPVIESLDGYLEQVLEVHRSSPLKHKRALETIAGYFKKEFCYDHLQYDRHETDERCVGILFCETAMDLVKNIDHHPNRILGGACFWKEENGQGYFLDWVWFHPFARNRGYLRQTWPKFTQNFGAFRVTSPLSVHMEKFLEKHHLIP